MQDDAEGVRLELTSPCGRRFSRAVPYQFGAPFQYSKTTIILHFLKNIVKYNS